MSRAGFVQGALVGLGGVGLVEVPLLVEMRAPVEAYPVVGSITVAAEAAVEIEAKPKRRTRKGNKELCQILTECAWDAGRTSTYVGAQ